MAKKAKKNNKKNIKRPVGEGKRNNDGKLKAPVFIIEKDGLAYYKDRRLNLVCRGAKPVEEPKYEGYIWQYKYSERLDWFKRYVKLFQINGANMRFVDMTEDEFYSLGGETYTVDGVEAVNIKGFRNKGMKL